MSLKKSLISNWYWIDKGSVPKVGFPGGTGYKELTCQCRRQETRVRSLCSEEPLEEAKATHCSIFAWRILWTEEPGKLWVHKELDTTELLTLSLHFTTDLSFSKIFLLNISPKRIYERPRGTRKKCSTLVAIREMEIKSTTRYKLISLLELWVNKCWYRCGEMKRLCIVMIVNCYSHYRKQ